MALDRSHAPPSNQNAASGDAVRRLLIFRIGSLGDTLVALPALRRIRTQFPRAKIVLLTKIPVGGGIKAASSFQVLQGSGVIDDLIEYAPSDSVLARLQLILRLRRLRPDKTIYLMPPRNLQQRLRDKIFLFLAGCGRACGLKFTDNATRRSFDRSTELYESEAARLLRSIDLDASSLVPADFSLQISSKERDVAAGKVAGMNLNCELIGISIGTKSPANDWGQSNWEILLRALALARPEAQLVFIGTADEAARCELLGPAFDDRYFNVCGQLSPRESGAVLASCDLFIGHDSGPMHLANAVGIPLIGIFSARNLPGIWFPLGNQAHVFYQAVSCAGCELDVCIVEQMRCIRSISPEAVLSRALQVLTTAGPQTQSPPRAFGICP